MATCSAQLALNYLSLYGGGFSLTEFSHFLSPQIKFKHFISGQIYLAKDQAGVATAFSRIFQDKTKIKIISFHFKKYKKADKTFKIQLIYEDRLGFSLAKKFSYKEKTYLTFSKTDQGRYVINSLMSYRQKI